MEAPTPALPKGGGAIRSIAEKFGVAAATGGGSMSIPLPLPPGRGGFGPTLALQYASGGGNGPYGLGWSLAVPAVTRKTDKGLPRYLDDDRLSDTFILSGAEDLVPLLVESPPASGTWEHPVDVVEGERREAFRPRSEGDFSRIERVLRSGAKGQSGYYWQATTKDNVTSTFGWSESARIMRPGQAHIIFGWLLEETRDDRGNVIRYEYKAEDLDGVPRTAAEAHRHDGRSAISANRYLKRILYGNKAGVSNPTSPADFHFEIVFDYGEHDEEQPTPTDADTWAVRQDPFSSYRSGFELRTYRLCQRVLVFHRFEGLAENAPPVLVRSLDLEYEQSPAVTYLKRATQKGYRATEAGYDAQALPPVDFDYSRATFSKVVRELDRQSQTGIPYGVDGRAYQFVDLDGEGVPGVLAQEAGALTYKRNLGEGKLARPRTLHSKPSTAQLSRQQLLDVTGSGRPSLVELGPILKGYYPRKDDDTFGAFRPFSQLPNINWSSPDIRFIDLDGDGYADAIMSDNHVYTWWAFERGRGYGTPRTATRYADERRGPNVVFREPIQTVFLADMTGDGLQDLVRIRNASVCYWPNLGHGHFGAMVTMGNAPTMAAPGHFDPARVRLADIDGTGTADLLYIGQEGVLVWMNQAGNAFSIAYEKLAVFPDQSQLSTVDVVDLLGTGTSCLVWSSRLPGLPPRLRYVDLLESTKPHLLTSVVNNLGFETSIAYTTSTQLYLEDQRQGTSWATRLPFPVQIVNRVEHYDRVSKNRFVSTYRYRHGFYDAEEREFRGFGYAEQRDAEHVGEHFGAGALPTLPIANGELPLPPVVTKTWFHTGAWLKRAPLLAAYEKEWFADNPSEPRLATPHMPPGLSAVELHQAHRALAGRTLRQEVYAEDGTVNATKPYVVTQESWGVRCIQPTGKAPYASFLTIPGETLTIQYERATDDPRIAHEMTLAVDELGYVTQSASIAYGHESGADHSEQERTWVLVSEQTFIHATSEASWYRHGVPSEAKSWEMGSGLSPAGAIFTVAEILDKLEGTNAQTEVPYHATPTATQKRLLSFSRERYWEDDLTDPLPFGSIESLALPYQSYAKAFTAFMLSDTLGGNISVNVTPESAGYEDIDADDDYWAKSGITHYRAASDYYLVDKIESAFGDETTITYDDELLFVTKVTDALSLEVNADIDYRVLAPERVTDPNGNYVEAAFDDLGRVTATAVGGANNEGDDLTGTDTPTTRITYELGRYADGQDADPPVIVPVRVKTEAREQHGGTPSWLVSYSYSDGSGNEVMAKVQAEPGRAPELDENGHPVFIDDILQYDDETDPRWVGTGRTVFDNKGNPIKQYEPYFSATEEYEDDPAIVEWGVTPILHYDPLGRLIRTDMPDGTFSHTTFDPWKQTVYDANDTAKAGQLWYEAATSAPERVKANAHADTPAVTYFDALGRPFAVREHNLTDDDPPEDEFLVTKSVLDIQGNTLALIDALDRTCMTYIHNMLGQTLTSSSIDAGDRYMFATAAGEPVKNWGERGFTHRAEYDALRRLTHVYVEDGVDEKLVQRLVYGETHADVADNYTRGRLVQHYDQSGVIITDKYDFKGNLETQTRRLATDYENVIDWSDAGHDLSEEDDPEDALTAAASALETETFDHAFAYDALNRPTSVITPDDSETIPTYNEAGLLEAVDVKVRGASTATAIVTNIDYDAHGRREKITYDNGTETTYQYDEHSFRLSYFKTTRGADLLQSLEYTYDAVGNIVSTHDTATHTVYFSATSVPEADADYTYDAVYRLVQATGREHEAGNHIQRDDVQLAHDTHTIAHPNDPSGLRTYTREYAYDTAGNITQMKHTPDGTWPGGATWTRSYTYTSGTNQLATTSNSAGTRSYSHDAHGNMAMPHLSAMDWDFADQLQHVEVTSGQDVYFVYDASGQRVRKVYEHSGLIEERIYLGGFELYRKRTGSTLIDERETLHVADDARRVCMIETLTVEGGSAPGTITPRFRFQLDNHLGTCCVETDDAGAVISYEEYHPYGTSAYRAMASGVEVSARRYRYTGKERDDETGLYLMGARYYACWLARWTAADPAGTVDGTNLYAYVRGSPVGLVDPSGTSGLSAVGKAFARFQKGVGAYTREVQANAAKADARANVAKTLGGIGEKPPLENPDISVGNLGRGRPSLNPADYEAREERTEPESELPMTYSAPGRPHHPDAKQVPPGPGPAPKPPRKPIWTGPEALARYLTEENPAAGKVVEGVQFTIGFALAGMSVENNIRAVQGWYSAGGSGSPITTPTEATRGPASGPKVVSPPRAGQVLLGGRDNPNSALVLEGHGGEQPGSFKLPAGTYLRVPQVTALSEEAGQAAAISGTFGPGTPSVIIPPGGSAPNLVLYPPTPEMTTRYGTTTVTKPTQLSDILEPNMGLCIWAACRTR